MSKNFSLKILFCLLPFFFYSCEKPPAVQSKTITTELKSVETPEEKAPVFSENDSLVFKSAKEGNLKLIKKLISEKGNINARGLGYASYIKGGQDEKTSKNWTALMTASYNNHIEVVQFLLDSGADVEAKTDVGNTALLYACQANNPVIAHLLLDHGADPKITDQKGTTPLHWAISYKHSDLAVRLIEMGADVNAVDTETGRSVVESAYFDGLAEVGDLLIIKGANANFQNKLYGDTPLMWTSDNNFYNSVQLLVKRGANVNLLTKNKMTSALARASGNKKDDIRIPAFLIKNGAKVNLDHDSGWLPLSEAARSGNVKIAKLLLEKGIDVNTISVSRGGITALNDAVFNGSLEMTKLLVTNGADVNAVTENGSSILLRAVWTDKNYAIVEYLISKGANVNLANEDGETPLLTIAHSSKTALVKLLLDHGANTNVRDVYGKTVLSEAIVGGNKEIIKMISARSSK